jgi:glycine cleavage system H protein
MVYPAEYRYSKEHEWISVAGNVGTIGITDYAQYSLGEIVFVDLPSAGSEVQAGKSFGTVESVKSVSDLFAPVSGAITEVNTELSTVPEKINADANAAWMIKVTLKDPAEVNSLLTAQGYQQFLADEDKDVH